MFGVWYFQGKRRGTPAYKHSQYHHVFINLQTEKIYCLPEGYEIADPSLDDIRHVLNSRFNKEQVLQLDENKQWSRALDGSDYLPGMELFFLIPENYQNCKSPHVHRFGELTRRIWHAGNFNGQVSPHEFLQAVAVASQNKFVIRTQSDPVEFMSWLLKKLHADLISANKSTSIIHTCFQGELEVVTEIHNNSSTEKLENGYDPTKGSVQDYGIESSNGALETYRMPFLMLELDLLICHRHHFSGMQWEKI
ncbi:hypothetical protein IFM89_016542 [Coptis chinensis]|uniref:Uncharacterized protein n=1 Tax=Coptis chinensis TaxID=261450 RepID=A0A835IA17_9MAGN|nr:hypothetical protein IFM89_016542 [Coptis chinensis]